MRNIPFLIIVVLIYSCGTNVQSDELLLDKIVQMEDQVQKMNTIQFDRGNGFEADIKSEYASTPKNKEMQMKVTKLGYIVSIMDKIDKETGSIISLIEDYKIDLLEQAGEKVKPVKNRDHSIIVWREYDVKAALCLPARLNLMAVKNKANSKIPTSYFVDADGINPSDKGLELWNKLNQYRSNLIEVTANYSWGNRDFEINPRDINSFVSNEDLEKSVRVMIENSNVNKNEDTQVLIDLYMSLTKMEQFSYHGTRVHWVSAIFNEAPLISAIASLSSLEQDILSARALALAHWKSRVAICGYTFNKIIPLATGPSTSFEGEDVKIQVLMAAFDSDNQPIVTTSNIDSKIAYHGDGTGIVSINPKLGLNTIKGTVSIKNKSGVKKTENWEWTINVLPKK